MLSRILGEAGHVVGKANTEGIYISEELVWAGDSAEYKGAGWVATDPRVTAAALEVNRLGLLTRGLYLKRVDVAALTNIGLEHIGDRGINSQDEMAALKMRVTDAASKSVVLNADDEHCRRIAARYPVEKTVLYSCEPDNAFIIDHLSRGGSALCLEGGGVDACIVFFQGARREEIIRVAMIPSAMGGLLRCNLSNGMAAAGMAIGMGVSISNVARGLGAFRLDSVENPGRFTILDDYAAPVLVNQTANPLAMRATIPAILAIPVSGRRFCLLTLADNHADEYLAKVVLELAGHFDRYLVYLVDRFLTVREPERAVEKIVRGFIDLGVDPCSVSRHSSLDGAVQAAFSEGGKEDLVVVLGVGLKRARESLEKEAARK